MGGNLTWNPPDIIDDLVPLGGGYIPLKIEWDLTNGPLRKLLELFKYPGLGVRSVGPVGDFLDIYTRLFLCGVNAANVMRLCCQNATKIWRSPPMGCIKLCTVIM